ncbi:hypothetical protein PHMEG_0004213 [Phytophthora megakarya]|uniref:Uncharacterized protein n=1 Tax=Phytophthora megakarya TaxID=4795 RepID=A0A225WUA6_9STRA|nr:hypothetical protein PHMEG_0004213 [Phytophthora megakarya]
MRHKTSSNANKHMIRIHCDHKFSLEVSSATPTNTSQRIFAVRTAVETSAGDEQKSKKQRTLPQSLSVAPDELRMLISR